MTTTETDRGGSRLGPGDRFPLGALATVLDHEHGGFELSGPAVVYFYPKDGTETCTLQAAEFNRHAERFNEEGVLLVGVSTDTLDAHACFSSDHGLAFPLYSDEDGTLSRKVGVLKDYGEYGELAARVTFLLDKSGIVRQVFEVEDVVAHPDEVLAAARTLKQGSK
jgi:peroxiredoxin Q/BCP